MTEEMVPVVIISLDGQRGYAIPFESEDDIRHLADDIVSAEFDHLLADELVTVHYGKFSRDMNKAELETIIRTWANGLLIVNSTLGSGHDFFITDEDERKIGLHPELKTRKWVAELEETDFEGW